MAATPGPSSWAGVRLLGGRPFSGVGADVFTCPVTGCEGQPTKLLLLKNSFLWTAADETSFYFTQDDDIMKVTPK